MRGSGVLDYQSPSNAPFWLYFFNFFFLYFGTISIMLSENKLQYLVNKL